MGSWDWDLVRGDCAWDEGQKAIFGVEPGSFVVKFASVRSLIDPDDWKNLRRAFRKARRDAGSYQVEFRILRPDGGTR
jgi:PAS domain-containing protein